MTLLLLSRRGRKTKPKINYSAHKTVIPEGVIGNPVLKLCGSPIEPFGDDRLFINSSGCAE
jgi:hypothetical protein